MWRTLLHVADDLECPRIQQRSMPKHYGPAYEKKRKKQRELEREVLQYLKDRNKPVYWEMLCVHFDPRRTGDIDPLLHELKDGHYIAVEQQKVTITNIGLKRLEAAMF